VRTRYEPEKISPESIFRELRRIADELGAIRNGYHDIHYAEPEKPREGDIVVADGTHWNPGGGEGAYRYTAAGTWSRLG